MGKYIPVDPEKWAAMVKAQSDLVRYKEMCDELDAECTRLKAEVERLTKERDKALTDFWYIHEGYFRLQAEVNRLTAFTTRTIIPNEELQAQVERLTKAGDAMADEMLKLNHPHASIYLWCRAKDGKGFKAEEGNQP